MNIEQMAAFADELADAFEKALGDGSGREPILKNGQEDTTADKLGEVFLTVTSKMTALYTVYCGRQAQANTRLAELMQDPMTSAYLKNIWRTIQPYTNAWDLGSMLIKPVQRVMKYPLLFGDLLQCTSPVHPDYFNLKKAFEVATSIAGEINEVKRRKDVVERIMIKDGKKRSPGGTAIPSKEPKVFGMSAKLREKFSKNKEKDKGISSNTINSSTTSISTIVPGSERQLYDLISKMDAADQVVRKVGKEINMWPERVRDTWLAQKGMMVSWSSVVRLDGSDMGDERIETYANMVDDIVEKPWISLEREVRESVMPVFSTLLRLGVNPKALIRKRESRFSDYSKVQQSSRSKAELKALEKSVMSGSEDFVALHTQLLEELPAYIEGHAKILDIALAGFAQAQARFYDEVRERLRDYLTVWTAEQEAEDVTIEVLDGAKIVKGWHECWKPFMQQIEELGIAGYTPKVGMPPRYPSRFATPSLQRAYSQQNTRKPEGLPPNLGNRSRSGSFLANKNVPIRTESDVVLPIEAISDNVTSSQGRRPISYLPPLARTDAIVLPELKLMPTSPGSLKSSPLLSSPRLDRNAQGEVMGQPGEWKDQKPMYQCRCVAEFNLKVDVWYAGLPFLNMEEGELIDILDEVGRVDQLVDLPIDVGVPDDGLLVGRTAERGRQVGLLLCSFLEPLR